MLDNKLLLVMVGTLAFPLILYQRKKGTTHTSGKEKPVYNLEALDTPRLVGFQLTLFPKLLRIPLIGNQILSFLKEKNKFSGMTAFASTLSNLPLYYPIQIMSEEERMLHNDMVTQSPLSIQQLAGEYQPCSEDEEMNENGVFRYFSIHDYTSRYKSGEITPLEVAKRLIKKVNDTSREYAPMIVSIDEKDVIKHATESTRRYKQGSPMGVLDGVPVAVKDEIAVKGYPRKKGTSFITNFADEDCECIARLRKEGAVIVGKTNQHELGLGTTGFNRFYGSPRNPHNFNHYTGGSSSGSAAAVAAGLVPLAIGTDGGGSIRIPSALCGVVGLKPTFKRIAYSSPSSVISIGPITTCPNDAALAYGIMAGPSNINLCDDSHLQPKAHLYNVINAPKRLEGLRIGFFRAHVEDAHEQIVNAALRTIDHLQTLGATVVEIEIPHLREIHLSHSATILTELYSDVHKYHNEHKSHYSGEVQISLEIGKSLSSLDFHAAQKVRAYAMSLVKELFNTQIDILISPATATVAPCFPDDALVLGESNLKQTFDLMKYAILGNFVGIPGLVIPPVGYDQETKLPISILLQSSHWREDLLFRVAKACDTMKPIGGLNRPQHYIGGGLD